MHDLRQTRVDVAASRLFNSDENHEMHVHGCSAAFRRTCGPRPPTVSISVPADLPFGAAGPADC